MLPFVGPSASSSVNKQKKLMCFCYLVPRVAISRILLAMFVCSMLGVSRATADVRTVGNVTPTVPDTGGILTNDLIVGNTEVGGLFMDIAPPLSGALEDLESPNGVIGNGADSIGRAVFDDFGVAWKVTTNLSVGNRGQGFLDVFDSASIEVGVKTVVGVEESGHGEIILNGVASRLVTEDLTVGEDGTGTIKVLARGALSSAGISIIGDEDQADGTVLVSGSGSRWTVGNTAETDPEIRLTIDNGSGGYGKLQIDDDGQVLSSGSVQVNPQGTIEFGGVRSGSLINGGTLRLMDSGSFVTNNGLISGDGFIDAAITIGGALSNRAAIANTREHLRVSGTVTNNGTIDSIGGEMTFEAAVTNTAEVIARDAIMQFSEGISNSGTITVGGNTTLQGDITNNGGSLLVLSGSESLLAGDLTFSGSGILALTAGPAAGTLDITGTADLTSATIDLNYSAGIASQTGDRYQILQAAGGIVGTFSGTASADGRLWDLEVLGNRLFATATGGTATPSGADFNGDGVVNLVDLDIWRNNYPSAGDPDYLASRGDANGDGVVDGLDFLQLQLQHGPVPDSTALAAVPEPTALLLFLTGLGCCRWRRRGL